ncbi:MAG: hypothetical protein ACD_37C00515G0001 [uncultured bacterium]|nr:MAG: hypothetical protein ACD_37C00515G0001 [uncultured bacterium]
MNKLVLSFSIVAFMAFAGIAQAASGTYGDNNCQPVYGGGETCITQGKVTINKSVKNPKTNAFVDNLTVNDPRFGVSQIVTFRLIVTNTGNSTISKIAVEDIFPSFVEMKSGPGTFDKSTKILSFEILNLNANESRTYTVTGQTANENQLPANENVTCVINQAIAKSEDTLSKDNSQFCIEKRVLTTKGGLPVMPAPKMGQTPSTGPEMLPLFGLIPAGIAGLLLRKRTSK